MVRGLTCASVIRTCIGLDWDKDGEVLGIVTVLLIFEAAMSGRRKKVDQGPRYKAVEQFDQVAASYLSRDRQLT